jgi:site-specific DNA-methyltransferase (adenine-specific)
MSSKPFINNCSAEEFLKSFDDASIDLILTDPPYIISKKSGFKSKGKKGVARFMIDIDFGDWDNVDIATHNSMLLDFFKIAYMKLRKGGTIIVWYDLWKLESLRGIMEAANKGYGMFRFIEMLKTNPVPINSKATYLSNAREVALVAVKGSKPTFNSKYNDGVFSYPIHRDGGKRIHPTQKSLDLMRELIEIHSNEGDLVVDPFSGSGTTVLAALQNRRKALGSDLDKEMCVKANARINKYYKGEELWQKI